MDCKGHKILSMLIFDSILEVHIVKIIFSEVLFGLKIPGYQSIDMPFGTCRTAGCVVVFIFLGRLSWGNIQHFFLDQPEWNWLSLKSNCRNTSLPEIQGSESFVSLL